MLRDSVCLTSEFVGIVEEEGKWITKIDVHREEGCAWSAYDMRRPSDVFVRFLHGR